MTRPKDYSRLFGNTAFSKPQLEAHLKLYEGYVKKLAEISERLEKADRAAANYSFGDYSELRRREPVAFNGVALHELYFDALDRPGGSEPSEEVKSELERGYGSWDGWLSDMKAAASSCHGWALVVWDPEAKKVRTNLVSSEHHVGLFANTRILMALDLWEHAYMIQYGLDKTAYLKALIESLDWGVIGERFRNHSVVAWRHAA